MAQLRRYTITIIADLTVTQARALREQLQAAKNRSETDEELCHKLLNAEEVSRKRGNNMAKTVPTGKGTTKPGTSKVTTSPPKVTGKAGANANAASDGGSNDSLPD